MGRLKCFAVLGAALAAVLLALVPARASANWTEAKSKHFIVYSDGSTKQLQDFADDLERFDFLLRLMTGVGRDAENDVSAPLRVWLLPNDEAVKQVTGNPNIGGLYFPSERGGVAIASRERASGKYDMDGKLILFHEYAHHFMLHYFPAAYPAWYVEGFAEFFSTAQFGEDGKMNVGRPPYGRAPTLIIKGIFPVAALTERNGADGLNLMEGDRYYGTAWLLTHYIEFRPDRKKEFQAYLRDLSAAKENVTIDSYFAGGIAQIEKDLKAYLNKPIRYTKLELKNALVTQVALRPMNDAENALTRTEMRFLLGVRLDDRPAYLAETRGLAARFPASAYAQALLAGIEKEQGYLAEATAAADRAVTDDGTYAQGLSIRADLLIDKASESGSAVDWDAARVMVIRANKADTEDPVPLKQFYRYTVRRGRGVPNVAYDGLWKAFGLVPQDPNIRFMLATAIANKGEYEEAARLMDPLANSPHGSGMRAAAIRLRRELLAAKASGGKVELMLGEEEPGHEGNGKDAATEPGVTEPGTAEPGTLEPAATEPAATEPATTEPTKGDPGNNAPKIGPRRPKPPKN